MINSNRLRGKIAGAGLTQKSFAKMVNLNENTVSAKVNGRSRLFLDEVEAWCELLGIHSMEEKAEIFFAVNIPEMGYSAQPNEREVN